MVIGDNSVDVGNDNEILMRVEFNGCLLYTSRCV